jgi:hypothetical protein
MLRPFDGVARQGGDSPPHWRSVVGGGEVGRVLGRPPAVNRGRRRRRLLSSWLAAVVAVLVVAAVGVPAWAIETPAGSKNFSAPRYVPNYFSNETGAFTGAVGARGVGPGTAPVYAAPRPASRSHYGYAAPHRTGRYRGHAAARRRYHHLVHGRMRAPRHFVHVAAHGRRQSLHARSAVAHHRAVRPRSRSSARIRHIARVGR